MNRTNDSSSSRDNAGEYMFFSYSIFIVIFLGLVGHSIALFIFSKPPLKWRPVAAYHINLSMLVLLLSIIGYTLSLVNCVKRNEGQNIDLFLCKLSVGLELSGFLVYALTSTLMMWHSYFMTIYQITSSTFYVSRRVKATATGLVFSWISGVVLGTIPPLMLDDFITFEDRISCHFSWMGRDGVNSYSIHLVIVWIYVPGLLALTAYIFTRRYVSRQIDISGNTGLFRGQIRSNKLNNFLSFFFYISILPYFTFGLITALMDAYFLPTLFMLVLEMLAKSHAIIGPFIFVSKSRTYKAHLGRLLSCESPPQVAPTSNSEQSRSTERGGRRTILSQASNQTATSWSRRNGHVTPLRAVRSGATRNHPSMVTPG